MILRRIASKDRELAAKAKCTKGKLGFVRPIDHASPAIEAHDHRGLERILRYMGRPPLSSHRLQLATDGKNLILQLKTPWRDGTSSILLSPFELLERLVALIPTTTTECY
jgi:hypothetical protein